MAKHAQRTNKKQEIFVCAVCRQRPVEGKLLDCLHTACSQCLHGLVNELSIVCPSCQYPTKLMRGVMALPDNHVLSTFSHGQSHDRGGAMTCDECDDDERSAAVARCRSCGLKLCDLHSAAHRISRRTKGHALDDVLVSRANDQIGSSVGAGGLQRPAICRLHGEPLDAYCSTCRCVMCSRCVPYGHEEHTKGPLTEDMATKTKKQLERIVDISRVDGRGINELEKVIVQAKRWSSEIEERTERVSDEIAAYFDKLRRLLTKREEELLATLAGEQKSLAAPYEKIVCDSTKTLSSYKLAHSTAEASLKLCDKIAMAEEEGVLSRRMECLDLETLRITGVAKNIPEGSASTLLTFTPVFNVDLEKMIQSSGAIVRDVKVDNVCAQHLGGRKFRLRFKVGARRILQCLPRNGVEATLKAVSGMFKFSISRQSWHSSSVSCATSELSSASSTDSAMSCTIQDIQCEMHVNSGRTEMAVTCTALSDLHFADGKVVIQLDNVVVGCCRISFCSLRWLFQSDGCPDSVSLSENGRGVWTTGQGSVMLVGDTEFIEGTYSWRVEVLAGHNGFGMAAGVTTSRKHVANRGMINFTGWVRTHDSCGRSSVRCNVRGELVEDRLLWNANDILAFTFDCSEKILTCTNTRTNGSDTIRGIPTPVYPCFGFGAAGRGVRLLDVEI